MSLLTSLKKVIKDSISENDGVSYCPFRIAGCALSAAGVPTFIGLAIYNTVETHRFDYMGYGTAFGMIMTGLGVLAGGIALKARTDDLPR